MYKCLDLELPNEIWKPIPNYEGIYEASSFGRIRTSKNKITKNKMYEVRHWKQRILKQKVSASTRNKNRYDARVELWKNGEHKTFLVARLIAATFLGESNLSVNHIDGNSLNNDINNLEWMPLDENIKHGFKNGLYPSKKIMLINKKTNEQKEFISLSSCSRYLGRNSAYMSNLIKNNKYEDKDYRWSLL